MYVHYFSIKLGKSKLGYRVWCELKFHLNKGLKTYFITLENYINVGSPELHKILWDF